MFGDLQEIESGATLTADLCIIGAGIAGISLARQFIGTPIRVCLIESGGIDYEAAIQELAAGEISGHDYYPLVDSRLRFFGGTTAIWGGRSALFDPIDLERRSWVPHSGWPIDFATLQPWYERARDSMGLARHAVDEQLWPQLKLDPVTFNREQLRTAFWQFDDRHAPYGARHCEDLRQAENIQVITRATVSHIQAHGDGQRIEHVCLSNPEGRRAQVQARHFVLAAGGIENARLLLAANDVHSNGLGNQNDCVGRYFMEHPHARGGRLHSRHSWRLLKLFARSHKLGQHRVAASLRPGEQLQAEAGILNTSFTLACRQHPSEKMFFGMRAYQTLKHELNPTKGNRRLWLATKRTAVWLHQRIDPLRPWLLEKSGRRGVYAVIRAEQAPNPDSRILLSQERDIFGVPRCNLQWRFSDIDKRSVRVTMQAFDRELQRLNLGRLEIAPWLLDSSKEWEVDPLISSHAIGGYHHMGSTRMAADPKQGVVDGDCKVHGIDNLHIAGSSVFTTSGWANPTLSLVALALRLGQHLKTGFLQPADTTAIEENQSTRTQNSELC
ncbi:MAG: GMC family oxidoreductase [Wenzhouxiangellaceae bacterium]